MITHAGPGGRTAEQEHVLYAAATSMDLRELLWTWEPWRPTWELPDMVANVAVLASTIIDLVDAGLVEVYAGPFSGSGAPGGPCIRVGLQVLVFRAANTGSAG
jgi:hypothetical protein